MMFCEQILNSSFSGNVVMVNLDISDLSWIFNISVCFWWTYWRLIFVKLWCAHTLVHVYFSLSVALQKFLSPELLGFHLRVYLCLFCGQIQSCPKNVYSRRRRAFCTRDVVHSSDEFTKLMATNSWQPFLDSRHFVQFVESLYGKYHQSVADAPVWFERKIGILVKIRSVCITHFLSWA